ncbi:alpha/beta hydrolase [Agromyces badenianii]|uniref:alpha/beta hydrolase n=1 Tax=Agromyces badenianii TaxID=2080742 RepID=UPI000D59F56B|nr:alpha/beta hydrolase-fold protein [Agromyces badenianii]PWC05720.1 esterase [Agromyces badenianii]
MWDFVLELNVVNGPFIIAVCAIAALVFLYLLFRGPGWSWVLTVVVLLIVGALVGVAVLWLAVNMFDAFGGPVDDSAWLWVPAASAGITLAIWNLWYSRWWRKLIALLAIPLFAAAAAFGVNAAYGLSPTLGSMLHISTADPIDPPVPDPAETADPAEPLYLTWTPPADLPATGEIGVVQGGVPNTQSGFAARPAQIYLPPAALVADAPRLPLVVMMMGQPGDPDASFIGGVLDEFAAKHDGLAPIALVIDQLGDPDVDPLCLDSELGRVESYVMQDVVPWAKQRLGVLQGRQYTTVAGYSNGGQCAAYFGAKHPEVFGNLLAVSPLEFAGAEQADEVLSTVFHDVQPAYDAVKPANIMASKAPYPDTVAVFTVGENDGAFVAGTERLADAAIAAGMQTTLFLVPGADHDARALRGGLEKGFEVLFPRLGLTAP